LYTLTDKNKETRTGAQERTLPLALISRTTCKRGTQSSSCLP